MSGSEPARDLTAFFEPSSVAIVGASDTPGKWGHALATVALRGASRRSVYLINPTGREILGQRTFRSLEELPEAPELVVLAVPMSGFDAAVDAALARGSKALVAISAGFAEISADGADHQLDVTRRIRAAGASLIGPNCAGLLDTGTDLDVSWMPGEPMSAGSVGLISQSGNIAFELARYVQAVGFGVSRLVCLGNQADIGVTEVIRSLARHDATRLLAVYCEDFRDGRAFLRATQEAVSAGKPVVLLAAGGDEASARAARSHTGSLTTDDAVVDAVCRATGAVRVFTPGELTDVVQVLLRSGRPRGRRLGILSDGGGSVVIATNVLTRAGFTIDPFSDGLRRQLAAALHETSSTSNPVDLAHAGLDPTAMGRVMKMVADSGEVDGLVLTGAYGNQEVVDAELGRQERESALSMARVVADASLPLIVQTAAPDTKTSVALREAGVPVFRDIERAVNAFSLVTEAAAYPQEMIADLDPQPDPVAMDGYFGARELMAAAGVDFPAAEPVGTLTDALAAAERIGYPVVLKAVSLLHKSDAGGVALNLDDEEALREAFERMRSTIGGEQYSVEAMLSDPEAVELVVGCRRDPRFGPVLLVGLGGIYAEVLRDVKLLVAPATPDAIERMLRSLRGAALLDGPRGRRPVNIEAVCVAAARISEVAARHPSIAEIEVNPLLAAPTGAIALDARIVLDAATTPPAAR